MRSTGTRRIDTAGVVIALALALLAAVLVLGRAAAPRPTSIYGIGPQVMPIVIAVGLGILAVGNLVDALRGDLPARESADPEAVLLILGGLALLIAIIGLGGGFILATTILFAATATAFGRRAIRHRSRHRLRAGHVIYLVFTSC